MKFLKKGSELFNMTGPTIEVFNGLISVRSVTFHSRSLQEYLKSVIKVLRPKLRDT